MLSSLQLNRRKRQSLSGETLIEVMVAVALMAFVMAPTAMLFETSRRNTLLNRDALTAEITAQNGIEAMRIIYGTNRLKFSALPECWNALPEATAANCEDTAQKIGEPNSANAVSSYVLSQDPVTQRWSLVPQTRPLASRGAFNATAAATYKVSDNVYRAIEVSYPDSEMMEVVSRVLYVSSGKTYELNPMRQFAKLSP